MRTLRRFIAGVAVTGTVVATGFVTDSTVATAAPASRAASSTAAAAGPYPYKNPKLPVAARVKDLLGRMTLAEKVGQMTQAERGSVDADPSQIATDKLGSLLSGGGSTPTPNTPTAWANMIDGYQRQALSTRLHIPLDLWDRLGARRQQPGRRDHLPAQHRHGRYARPGAGASGGVGRRHGNPGDRPAVGLRAVRLRGSRRSLGPHLRVVRRRPRRS